MCIECNIIFFKILKILNSTIYNNLASVYPSCVSIIPPKSVLQDFFEIIEEL